MYSIRYETIDAFGNETEATGLVSIPLGALEAPTVCFHNITETEQDVVPSRSFIGTANGIYNLLLSSFAGSGYLAVAPDYIGLGGNQGFHPYLHVDSQASAAIDAIRAARQLVEGLANLEGSTFSNDLFLFGYSQGGHAALSTHREIEENLSDEFSLIASAAGAGPYDLDGAQIQESLANPSDNAPLYLCYLVYSMNEVYAIESDLSTIIKQPYADMLPDLFDGSLSSAEILAQLPSASELDQLLVDTSFETLQANNPEFFEVLKENSLDEWVPQAPVLFLYADADIDVSPENTNLAHRFMLSENAPVRKQRVGTNRGHLDSGLDALVQMRLYFDSFFGATSFSYEAWQNSTDNFSLAQILMGNLITGQNADPNFDRIDNLICYGLGMDPLLPNNDVLPQVRLNDAGFLEMTVISRIDDPALSVIGQVTHTPFVQDSWSSDTQDIEVTSEWYIGGGFQQTVYTSTTLFDPDDLQFIRALVELENE
ncbi:MAG: lipase family protein [Verrucomicrobiota bacterium]